MICQSAFTYLLKNNCELVIYRQKKVRSALDAILKCSLSFSVSGFNLRVKMEMRMCAISFQFAFNLFIAVSPPTSWDITLSNKTASSFTIDWSSVPVDLVASFFIISLNQTPRAVSQDGIPNEPMNFLSIAANSSQTFEVVRGLPAFSEFLASVYLVDINNDIYKSNTLIVETEESGKLVFDFNLNCVKKFCMHSSLSEISHL